MPSELDAVKTAMDEWLIKWWQNRNPNQPALELLRLLDVELMRAHKVVVAGMWAQVQRLEAQHGSSGTNA